MLLSPSQLREIIVPAIANAAGIAPEEIDDNLNLFELGLDSLDLAGILIDIEDGIGAEIPAEMLDQVLDIDKIITIREVLGLLSTWDPANSAPLPGSPRFGEVIVVDRGSTPD